MKRKAIFVLLFLLGVVIAAAIRIPSLHLRPMHADEAVQATRFRELWQAGRFVYDPDEFHGPTLIYATLPSPAVGGAATFAETTESTYRAIPVFFGISMILLFWLLADALGKSGTVVAVVLAAISPAMVFYSRYYIHETLLTCFLIGAIACGWRYVRGGKVGWCLASGVCIGLMQATKETAVITYVAAGVSFLAVALLGQRNSRESVTARYYCSWRHLLCGLIAAITVSIVLFSSFFTNLRGPMDGVLTYLPWLARAGGETSHLNPWYFYLQRLVWWRGDQGMFWSEGLIVVLAIIAVLASIIRQGRLLGDANVAFIRWLGMFTFGVAFIYSAIPYKTPWCLLQFLSGMVLLAGVGAVVSMRVAPGWPSRLIVAGLLLVGAGHLGWQAYLASYTHAADSANPYAYASTSADALRLADQLEQLAAVSTLGWQSQVKVIWNDSYYWPLPWYLRRFENVEWWTSMPPDPTAPLVISSPNFDKTLTSELGEEYLMTEFYELRPQVLAQLWVRMDLWEAYLRHLGRL